MPNHGFHNQMCKSCRRIKIEFFALENFFVYVFTHTFDSGVSLYSWMLWPTVRRRQQPRMRGSNLLLDDDDDNDVCRIIRHINENNTPPRSD